MQTMAHDRPAAVLSHQRMTDDARASRDLLRQWRGKQDGHASLRPIQTGKSQGDADNADGHIALA